MARRIFTARTDALARIPLRPVRGPSWDAGATDLLLDEAVTVANGSARNAAERTGAGALTWHAYATRSRTRTTPQGVFAGVATATFSPTPELRLGADHQTATYPDPGWLSRLAHVIIDGAAGLTKVTLTTSNLAVVRGDRCEIECPMDGVSSRLVTTSVRNTEVTAFVLRTCRNGAPAEAVLAKIARRWPRGASAPRSRLLRELIDRGFLLHDLLPDDPRCDPLGHLLDRLPTGSPHRRFLEQLREWLTEADHHRVGSPERLALLADALAAAREILPASRLLRTDTAADATVTLPVQVAQKAAEAAEVLWRIGWGTDPLAPYHQRFLTRYGVSRAVPLLDVLDPVVGLGPVDDATAIGVGAEDAGRQAVLARLLSDAIAQGRTEIALDEATVDRLTNRSPASAPRSAEIYVRVLATDTAAGRRFQVAVSGGSQDALSTGGRFAPLLGRPLQPHERQDGTLVAELVVRPRVVALTSVTVETGLTAHRIPVGVVPRPGDLDLTDLTVFSDGRRLIVWSQVHDQQVRPVLYARTALPLLPPVAQFLAMAGHSGERPWHCWSWMGVTAPFTPTVRYRGTWLAPARWLLPPHLICAATSSDRWEPALRSWRSAVCPRPPDVVVTDDVDRQLSLDLRQVDDRELLRRYVRRGLAAVTAPPGGDHAAAVLPGPDGDHLLELVVCLDRTAPATAAVAAVPPVRRPGEGRYLPGGHWLSLAVQAPAACHEQILRSLEVWVQEIPDRWDRWFWLRYHDSHHGEQIRVRFHADPAEVCGVVLPSLSRLAADLQLQRLISGFCVEPYDQEIERYGGPAAITAAERFFDADSRLALTVLSATRQEEERLAIAANATAVIAGRIGNGTVSLRGRLDRVSHRRVNALSARARDAAARPFPPYWEAALDTYAAALASPPAEGIASDLIHLHCNRLVPGREHLVRALAADLIARRVHLTEGSR